MDLNEHQARWLVSQGWCTPEQAKELYRRVARKREELVGYLVRKGQIDERTAESIRRAAIPGAGGSAQSTRRGSVQSTRRDSASQLRATSGRMVRSASARAAPSAETFNKLRAVARETAPITPGRRFQDYELEEELGRGAMGVIMRARHLESGRRVALKFMLDSRRSERGIKRFQKEAKTLISLSHPNIVEITDWGDERGTLYYAMEFLQGQDLKERVKASVKGAGHPPPWRESLEQLLPIARALRYCHAHGVFHRDIKPANVLIEDSSKRPVLLDFGLLKKEESEEGEDHGLTKSNEAVGTPAFMAPEQFMVDGRFGKVGPNTDTWGWGATLYYALTGKPPFQKRSVVEVFRAILDKPPRPPSALNPEVPEWVDELLADCFQHHHDRRLDMDELIQRIEDGLEGRADPRPPVVIWGAAAGAVIAAGLLAWALWPRTPQLRSLVPAAAETREASVEVTGEVSAAGLRVSIGEASTVSDADGRFRLEVPLSPGSNRLEVQARRGGLSLGAVEVWRDSEAPELRFDSEGGSADIVNVGDDGMLRGQLSDDSLPGSIEVAGERVTTSQDGRFEVPVKLGQRGLTAELIARDRLGNERRRALTLRGPAARRLAAAHERLATIQRWSDSSQGEQDEAIAAVAEALGEGWRVRGTQTWTCGGASHRIATLNHAPSKLDLNLIPGGELRVEWWTEPASSFLYEVLVSLSRDDSLEVLGYMVRNSVGELDIGSDREIVEALLIDFGLNKDPIVGPAVVSWQRDRRSKTREVRAAANEALEDALRKHFKDERRRELLKAYGRDAALQMRRQIGVETTTEQVAPFLCGVTEVARADWHALYKDEASDSRHAVNFLADAEALIATLARVGLRLPTTQEWWFACAGGVSDERPWFDVNETARYAWCRESDPTGNLHTVDDHLRARNAFGLCDMLGHVEEWTAPTWDRWWEALGSRPELAQRREELASKTWCVGGWRGWPAVLMRRPLGRVLPLKVGDKLYDGGDDGRGFRVACSLPAAD